MKSIQNDVKGTRLNCSGFRTPNELSRNCKGEGKGIPKKQKIN
jgi:hypothetical protein